MPLPQIAIDQFSGPLDLLSTLVQKKEIDPQDVEIRAILIQIFDLLQKEELLELGADSIGHAGLLLLLKSRALLPPKETENQEEILEAFNPDILDKLVHYCQMREKAVQLSLFEEKGPEGFHRPSTPPVIPEKPLGIEHISLEEFAHLFKTLLSKAKSDRHVIHEEEWRVSDKMGVIKEKLKGQKEHLLDYFFNWEMNRIELIVTFLAVLELMKNGIIFLIKRDGQHYLIRQRD